MAVCVNGSTDIVPSAGDASIEGAGQSSPG
jgi:hypothetical protein